MDAAAASGSPGAAATCCVSLPTGTPRLACSLGLLAGLRRWHPLSVAREGLLGCLELLVGVFQAPADGECIALHQIMHTRKDVRHTQALQALFSELDQGLRPVTDQGQDLRSQRLEPCIDQRVPCGTGAIVCDVLQHQVSRRHVLKDDHHAFQEGFIHAADHLSDLASRSRGLLPGLCCLSRRRLQCLHHMA